MKDIKIIVIQECDGFTIQVEDDYFRFNQEDGISELVKVFSALGFDNVEFEEVY